MLVIRLQRVGRKNDPNFRVVVTDSRNAPKSGSFVEIVGHLNPKTKKTELKNDRIKEWILKGAQLSPRAHNLCVDAKIIEGAKIDVVPKASLARSEPSLAGPEPAKTEEKKEETKKEEAIDKPTT